MNELIERDLGDLALFARVVEAGGFTAAAKLTGVPQTTLSRRVAALEERLGLRLLDRTTRRVAPTEAGRRIHDHARRMVEAAEEARAAAATVRAEPSGLVRLSAPVVFGQHVLGPAAAAFAMAHPKVRLQVTLSGRRVDLIEEGIDIAVRVGDLPDSSLSRVPLMTATAAYYARADVAARVTAPADLARVPWLDASTEGGSARWQAWPVDGHATDPSFSLARTPRLTANETETLIAAARAGMGVAVLPTFAAPDDLVRVLPLHVARRVEINALIVSRRSIVPAVRALLDHLKAWCLTLS